MASVRVTIVNARGLHARAAAAFVRKSADYAAEIAVTRGEMTVNGRSIMGLLMLGASKGTEIALAAEGEDAGAALEGLRQLVESGFGETA